MILQELVQTRFSTIGEILPALQKTTGSDESVRIFPKLHLDRDPGFNYTMNHQSCESG